MPSRTPRRRKSGGARLAVTVLAPDGNSLSARGLVTWLKKAAPSGARGDVTVALVSDGRMRALNRTFRGKDYATDVLSFPVMRTEPSTSRRVIGMRKSDRDDLGDIVIATGVAQRQADEAGHPVGTELRVLALHGLLHLLGYDHERDSGEMARLEARLRKNAALKEGVIGRNR